MTAITNSGKSEIEILSADFVFPKIAEIQDEMEKSKKLAELSSKLDQANADVERYTNKADKFDYAAALASGILCGVIDSIFVGELTVSKSDVGMSHKQVNQYIERFAKDKGWDGQGRLKSAIAFLEKEFPVPNDNVWKGRNIGIAAKNHHLADFAHHPTPLGLVSSIIAQFFRVSTFVNQKGDWHFVPMKTEPAELVRIWMPAIITGVLNWLVTLAEQAYEEEAEDEVPIYVHRIAHLLASAPLAIQLIKCADNWYGHLVSDMGGSKNTAGKGMGIPGIFLSLQYEMASVLGIVNDKSVAKLQKLNDRYVKDRANLRHELPVYKNLGKQALPVLLNEVIVRTFYFVRHLVEQVRESPDGKKIQWDKVIPFDNRTLDRMLTISSLTFTFADTADASIRAAIESGGNYAIFPVKFLSRYNYVGGGRAVISVVKEISNEEKEKRFIHERRLLMEEKSEETIRIVREYRTKMEELVAQYIAEDLERYMLGFDDMDNGFSLNDSDLFIKGNVRIQSAFGKEIQFTCQEEFDDLMTSEESLKL